MKEYFQEKYSPKSICFGCGPANSKGLHIRSYSHGSEFHAEFKPEPHHQAFPGVLNGGIIGTLLDCHCNGTAAWTLMTTQGLPTPPCTVTAEYSIKLLRPTPADKVLLLAAKAVSVENKRVVVKGTLSADGKVTATCEGAFVAVDPGHPAYHRW